MIPIKVWLGKLFGVSVVSHIYGFDRSTSFVRKGADEDYVWCYSILRVRELKSPIWLYRAPADREQRSSE